MRHAPPSAHPRRPKTRRSWKCVSASRMALYAANTRPAFRSGWRKPAVVSETRLQRLASHLSRRGDLEAVCTRTPLQLDYHTHGGLTPAALGPASHGRRTLRDFRGTALGSRNHGGLTPAALVNVRSCIAKIVFSPANVRTAPTAGGVSPPWETKHRCKSQSHICDEMRLRRLLLLLLGPVLQIPTAFLQRPACVQPGAAGVNQPWFRKHAYSGNIAIVAHGRPAGCLSTNTVATALPDPRRVDAAR
jgi:hypothetical protein